LASQPRLAGRLWVVGVLALAVVLFAVPAGRRPFWSSDEARFAVLAQDILEHGRWLVPDLRGQPYLNKPQLYFWSIALASLPLGHVTERTAAIPSVLSAVLTVGAVVAIGQLLWSWNVGLLAGLVLMTTPAFYGFSHVVFADVMMTAFMTWALYCVLRAAATGWGAGWLLGFYACVGAGVLAKGPAALAILAAGGVAVLASDGRAALPKLRPLLGLAVLGVVAVIWIAPYFLRSQGHFVSRVVVGHYAPWYLTGAVGPRVGQLALLLLSFLPWTVLLAAAVFWWRRSPDRSRRRLGAATLTLALLLGLSGTQRARYLLPVYPGLALLTAEFCVRAARSGPLRWGLWALAVLLAVASLAAPVVLPRLTNEARVFVPESALELAALSGLALAAAAFAAVAARRGAFATGAAGVALILAGALLVVGALYPHRYTRDNDLRPLAQAADQHTPPGAAVVVYPEARLSLDFYLRRPVLEALTVPVAVDRAAATRGAVWATERQWAELAPALPAGWRVVARRQVADRTFVVAAP
jgi:4-amino-4-deoxy-L-arabinose transferase